MATRKMITTAELDVMFCSATGFDSMPDGWTPAVAWVRVSSRGQDEESQAPDIIRHCTERHYWIMRWIIVHGKSAYHAEHDPYWEKIVAAVKRHVATTVVLWKVDRLDRMNTLHAVPMVNAVINLGGCIEFASQPYIDLTTSPGRMAFANMCEMAYEESSVKSDRIMSRKRLVQADDKIWGTMPWGYEITGDKYLKEARPTDICRKYAPMIFARCIAGDSGETIARWLDEENVPTVRGGKWHAGSVYQILRNKTYAGHRQNEGDLTEDGKPTRRNKKTINLVEAVISMEVYNRAQKALKSRPRRGKTTKVDPPMLGKLRCARCDDSPMYRIKSEDTTYYYRCYGRGPHRKGCGNMIPVQQLDTIITTRLLVWYDQPYTITAWTEGNTFQAEIDDTKAVMSELDPESEEDEAKRVVLKAKIKEYRQQATEGHEDEIPTGKTIGEHFYSLNAEGKREFLKAYDIRAEKIVNPPQEPGATVGARIIIDGHEHGVFPYPPPRAEYRPGKNPRSHGQQEPAMV